MHLEGWISKNYYIILKKSERQLYMDALPLKDYLPDQEIFGLFNWDYFIVHNHNKEYSIVPTIPLSPEHLTHFAYKNRSLLLTHDPTLTGKIKWYKVPLVFGGDKNDKDNVTWIDIGKHAKLVASWNKKYREQFEANT